MQFTCSNASCRIIDLVELAYPNGMGDRPPVCTCCQGKPWHGQFPREKADDRKDFTVNGITGIGLG